MELRAGLRTFRRGSRRILEVSRLAEVLVFVAVIRSFVVSGRLRRDTMDT